jgi:hypothetical protein
VKGCLLFRDDTAVFATGNLGATFVHGSNSPQERAARLAGQWWLTLHAPAASLQPS